MVVEVFKPIIGYEGLYEVSNLGNVRSCDRNITGKNGTRLYKGRPLAIKDDTHGYLTVNLWRNNKLKHFKVHKLVALAFIPNPDNLRDVNHKDENPYNNNVENLEWLSHKSNINYGTRNTRANSTHSKTVAQYSKETKDLLATYKNAYIAEEQTGICETGISACCTGKRKSAGGYIWKFV